MSQLTQRQRRETAVEMKSSDGTLETELNREPSQAHQVEFHIPKYLAFCPPFPAQLVEVQRVQRPNMCQTELFTLQAAKIEVTFLKYKESQESSKRTVSRTAYAQRSPPLKVRGVTSRRKERETFLDRMMTSNENAINIRQWGSGDGVGEMTGG